MQTPLFQKNLKVISARWPQLARALIQIDPTSVPFQIIEGKTQTISVYQRQLSSRHDRDKEAQQMCQVVDEKEPYIYQYGFGLGDASLVLLKRPALKRLHICLFNLNVFCLILHLIDFTEIFKDPRVQLKDTATEKTIYKPFIAFAPELDLADLSRSKIRDLVLVSLKWFAIQNHCENNRRHYDEHLMRNYELLQHDPDVSELFNTARGRTACILASGPTLALHEQHLKALTQQENPPLLICLDTAWRTVKSFGIQPDIIVSIDKNINQNILSAADSAQITLAYSPIVQNHVLKEWRGKRYAFFDDSMIFDSLRKKMQRTTLYVNGSVIHPATDLAIHMGAKEIIFFGADFSFPLGRTHASWGDGQLGPSYQTSNHVIPNGNQEPVKTLFPFVLYLNYLEHLIEQTPSVRFFNTSKAGAMIRGTHFHPELTV